LDFSDDAIVATREGYKRLMDALETLKDLKVVLPDLN
jgi:hypothetical protein